MKRWIGRSGSGWLAAAAGACWLSMAASGAQAGSQPDVARMEQIVQSYVTSHQFMGTVLVAEDGKILLDQGYGFANLEWQVPDAPDVKFRLGSMTKQFTAASILLLEQRGKLNTGDPVKKYMPDAPPAWDKITLYDLLTHTSGIPSFTSFPDYHANEWKAMAPAELVAWFRDKPLDFEPGTQWKYSNSGYVLLGYLVEKISGESYAKFLEENIFEPLGMKDSGYDSNAAIIPHRASGYTPGANGPENAGFINMAIPFSAGALYSTTHDLLKWEEALFGGKVLSAAEFTKMTTPFRQDYACGLLVQTESGHKVIWHNGGIEGFNTHMSYYPDDELVVIVLSNLNGAAPDAMGPQLAAVAHGEKVVLASERKEVSVPASVLTQYVGTYQLAPTFSIVVAVEGDRLTAQATNQPKLPLFAESQTKFFFKVVDAEIEFVQDDQGKVTSLVLHQGGHDMKGMKQ
jgi:CubicO group peptidase (beta-lactamase class C family)